MAPHDAMRCGSLTHSRYHCRSIFFPSLPARLACIPGLRNAMVKAGCVGALVDLLRLYDASKLATHTAGRTGGGLSTSCCR